MVNLLLAIIYISFVSLGLPDSLLGAAWPSMYEGLGVPLSYAGIISMITAIGTVISSLSSNFLTKKIGTGLLTALSVAMTAFALFAFSVSNSFVLLCIIAVPYGLGAGSIDAALNNYVALHYSSKHMSWLHCMWGVGTIIGPSLMSYALISEKGWSAGYSYVSVIQIILTVVLVFSLPLWKKRPENISDNTSSKNSESLSLLKIIRVPGAKEVMISFFCYCALEQTAMLWVSSYMVLHNGISEESAALYASIFFIGITLGRLVNGFLTMRFSDTKMVRIGMGILTVGCLSLFLPFGQISSIFGVSLLGLGCAPIYPCIIHSTPERFGPYRSQAMIGVQMASAYIGTCLMPPLFGIIANNVSVSLLPVYLTVILAFMFISHERLVKKTSK